MAFPNNRHSPTEGLQRLLSRQISFNISREFRKPKIESALRCVRIFASGMPVPKASVHEYAQPVLGEYQVRFSRQILPMQTIAKPHLMTHRSDEHFRLRVFAFDQRHDLGAVFWGNYVCTHSMYASRLAHRLDFLIGTASLDFSFFFVEIRSHH